VRRIFVKVGFEQGMSEGVMDNESGEFMKGDEETGEGRSESEIERLVHGCWRETGSSFQRKGEAYRKERSVICKGDDENYSNQVWSERQRWQWWWLFWNHGRMDATNMTIAGYEDDEILPEKVRCSSKIKPRLRAVWVVFSEEFCNLASCLLRCAEGRFEGE